MNWRTRSNAVVLCATTALCVSTICRRCSRKWPRRPTITTRSSKSKRHRQPERYADPHSERSRCRCDVGTDGICSADCVVERFSPGTGSCLSQPRHGANRWRQRIRGAIVGCQRGDVISQVGGSRNRFLETHQLSFFARDVCFCSAHRGASRGRRSMARVQLFGVREQTTLET